MFNRHDIERNECRLTGPLAAKGYDWWWHSFTGTDPETGSRKSFFIEFFLCNPESGRDKPTFGQNRNGKPSGNKPSYLMVKAGAWGQGAAQIHRFFGWNRIEVEYSRPFSISAGDCYLSETGTRGSISVSQEEAEQNKEWMTDAGVMSWSLIIDKRIAFNVGYGAGKLFRKLNAFDMFWHTEGMKTLYKGDVIWNGRRYVVTPDDCYGYADKNWGKDFTTPRVWLSSCNLKSEITGNILKDSVFDIGGGRPTIGKLALDRKLLSALWYEGKPYEFNFSKFWTFCRTKFNCKETRWKIVWHIEQRTIFHRFKADIVCNKDKMVLARYESPDGKRRHKRLWSGGNGYGTLELYTLGRLVDRIHAENVGCEFGEYKLTSNNAKAPVTGSSTPAPRKKHHRHKRPSVAQEKRDISGR